ncbi:MAG TPA: anthranilate phosphoribosyltransferase [Candidatus Deferrimicrobium sp.]|nr:anthranilate phosphoribosyltransferase [Candidatus Deferrimicrobium sp.]
MIREGIEKVIQKQDLTFEEAKEIMREMMSGKATEAQIGSFLTGLRMKGETIPEISGFATIMREFCARIHPKTNGRLVDTCGTGGDKVKTFNISTIAAFVVAGAGIAVAKHGNRSVTSKSGSADVLEHLGYNLNLEPKQVEEIIEKVGIGFMFAPKFHPAMKYAIGPRREMGIRTVFNILGPLTNPANATAQVLGVFAEELVEPLAYVLKELQLEEAAVVYGHDGMDELSTIGKSTIALLKNGEVISTEVSPKTFGFKIAKPEDLRGASPEENAELTYKLLNNLLDPKDPKRDIVLLNAAAGILVGGKAGNFTTGIELAIESIETGAAYKKLNSMIKASNGNSAALEELEQKYA